MDIYCTDTDIKDVYSHIDKFDSKVLVAGWSQPSVGIEQLFRSVNTGLIGTLFIDGVDMSDYKVGSIEEVNQGTGGNWYYNTTDDVLYVNHPTNLNLHRVEGGSTWADLKLRYRKNASRFINSHLDSRLPREHWKDKEGNFDYVIVRLTALTCAWMLLKASKPKHEDVKVLEEEVFATIGGLVDGEIKLSRDVTMDSSGGIIREVVNPSADNPLRLVDVRGEYSGTYELLKVVIDTGEGGAIGTGKFTVYGSDSTGLKQLKILDSETITGLYQPVGHGMHIRFQGRDDDAVATVLDEWEIELYGASIEVDNASIGSIQMSRR